MIKNVFAVGIVMAVLGLSSIAAAQFRSFHGSSIIDDPDWRKSFLGSYGFLSGAEPEIRPDELEVLREVIDLMKVNPSAAATMLQRRIGPDSSAALDFVLANLDFQNSQLEAATRSYESAIEKYPDFRRAHKNLGLLQVQQGEFGEALHHLSRAIELGDRDGRSFGLMGYCHLKRENPLAAETAYRNAILQQPDVEDWKLGLARSLLSMKHYKDAVALFEDLIGGDPENSVLWMLQANAYVGLEQPRAAAVNLEAVRMLGKAEPGSLRLLGDIYIKEAMYESAKEIYLELIEQDRSVTGFETAYRAASLLVRTRAQREAGALLDSIQLKYAKQLGVDDELRLLTLQAKLARLEGRDAKAAEILESVVERDGTRGDALLELAAYHVSMGDKERAVLLFERARRIDRYEYQALLEQAQLMVSDRQYAAAADLLRSALAIKTEPRVKSFLARVAQAASR